MSTLVPVLGSRYGASGLNTTSAPACIWSSFSTMKTVPIHPGISFPVSSLMTNRCPLSREPAARGPMGGFIPREAIAYLSSRSPRYNQLPMSSYEFIRFWIHTYHAWFYGIIKVVDFSHLDKSSPNVELSFGKTEKFDKCSTGLTPRGRRARRFLTKMALHVNFESHSINMLNKNGEKKGATCEL